MKLGCSQVLYSWANSSQLSKGRWNDVCSSKGVQLHCSRPAYFFCRVGNFALKGGCRVVLDSSLLAPSLLGQYGCQLWEINVFQFPLSTAKHMANAKYLLQIFMLVCKINVNDTFVITCVPPVCGPAVFLWIISLNGYYKCHIAPWNLFLLYIMYIIHVVKLCFRKKVLKFFPGCLSVHLL